MADIQSPTAEIRRGKKKKNKWQDEDIYGLPYYIDHKEIVFGSWVRHNTDLLTSSGEIERVSHFKLLDVYADSTLVRNMRIDYITKKAAQCLYFLKYSKGLG